jgi:hypothetical protein
MPINWNAILLSQFEASLSMLKECLQKCPHEHSDGLVAKYPFWMVAYHTLCFIDVYLSPRDVDWIPQAEFHPKGRQELEDEFPSRRFTLEELLKYCEFCHEKMKKTLLAESEDVLAGPSGFPRRQFTRAELHLYNLRHIQHHTGQMTAFLRKIAIDTNWVGTGWK